MHSLNRCQTHSMAVCVCERERERARGNECECHWESVSEPVLPPLAGCAQHRMRARWQQLAFLLSHPKVQKPCAWFSTHIQCDAVAYTARIRVGHSIYWSWKHLSMNIINKIQTLEEHNNNVLQMSLNIIIYYYFGKIKYYSIQVV